MATNPNNKDTIYIDVDDEITSIIDKVRASKSRIVALVLPKRASVLQSVVNMKLLKRTSDNAQKQVVLITSEAGLLPLAGAVGMYVANTLQSKPSIPDFDAPVAAEDDVEEAVALDDTFDPKAAAAVPVGELAADDAPAKVTDEAETIDLDDEADATPATAAPAAASGAKKPKANKKLAVPNFNRFRLWLFLGALGLILLIFLGYLALVVLPKATVTAVTQTSSITTSKPITLSTQQKAVSTTDNILPANIQQAQKTASQQAAA
ncbi:MAG: hypothetical protein JWM37_565, partial [Candidatus Saccharibacteria bacterium]|nr:hypothetical protein [Candidatus Saccharibacteria bacterium]